MTYPVCCAQYKKKALLIGSAIRGAESQSQAPPTVGEKLLAESIDFRDQ